MIALACLLVAPVDTARGAPAPAGTGGIGQEPYRIEAHVNVLPATRIDASGRDIRLEVDGGIKIENIRDAANAGADTFVAGSAIFGQHDYKAVIDAMRARLAT